MQVTVNGDIRNFSGKSISDLLEELGVSPSRVAVELNLDIVPKEIYESTHINQGDRIEIVHFVGGG